MATLKEALATIIDPKIRHIVPISGGKDSAALAVYMCLNYSQINVEYIFPSCSSQILSLLFMIPSLTYYKLKRYNLFHLHWTGSFNSPIKILQPFYSWYFLFILKFLKLLDYKLIWTVHNLVPHEKLFVNDLKYRQFLANLADMKIVHSNSVIEEMDAIGINAKNTHIIPIGNYAGLYENKASKEEARKKLNLSHNDFVFLFFGNIRRYKGIECLLEAFERLSKNNGNVKLILAGECGEPSLLKDINGYEKIMKNKLISHIYHIDDKDIQYYFNSADIIVFPFKKVTTSSSVLLAFAYSKPIIAPRIGCLNDIPKNTGFFYNSLKKNALYNTMNDAIKRKSELNYLGKNAEIYSRSLSWDKISEKTLDLYRRLIE